MIKQRIVPQRCHFVENFGDAGNCKCQQFLPDVEKKIWRGKKKKKIKLGLAHNFANVFLDKRFSSCKIQWGFPFMHSWTFLSFTSRLVHQLFKLIKVRAIHSIERGIRNKFLWSWMDEKDTLEDFFSEYFGKMKEPGMARCLT